MNSFNYYIIFPLAGSGWIVGQLCNSSTASSEGTKQQCLCLFFISCYFLRLE